MEEKNPTFLSNELKWLEKDKIATDQLVDGYKGELIERLPSDLKVISEIKVKKQSKFSKFIDNIKKFL